MAEPFLAEIRIFGFDFPPKGWAHCDGQFMPINQNQALYALLGTQYGGDGRVNFQLPDLRGRTPVHMGTSYSTVGIKGGESAHTLSVNELPMHTHFLSAQNVTATTPGPGGALLAASSSAVGAVYGSPTALVAMSPLMVGNTGGSQPHENMQPYLSLNFCIALQGIFPSPN
ncbi:MAG TPA: tail fiber protein [Thermoanaerobaculia bacterium]|nr:tail fiber protein [Thermoanaerobaculia bacterium]